MDDATAGLIDTQQARELIEAINEQLGSETIQFYPGSGHRHLMVWVAENYGQSVWIRRSWWAIDRRFLADRGRGGYLAQADGCLSSDFT